MSEDPLVAFTGDRAAAEVMRRSLRAVADDYADRPLGAMVREVLAGLPSGRTQELEAAIREHRETIGDDDAEAADLKLWSHLGDDQG